MSTLFGFDVEKARLNNAFLSSHPVNFVSLEAIILNPCLRQALEDSDGDEMISLPFLQCVRESLSLVVFFDPLASSSFLVASSSQVVFLLLFSCLIKAGLQLLQSHGSLFAGDERDGRAVARVHGHNNPREKQSR